jgi:hypothetical protein
MAARMLDEGTTVVVICSASFFYFAMAQTIKAVKSSGR